MQVFGVDTGFEPFGLMLSVVLAIVLVATWIILAGSRFIQGGVVERPERVPQLYGYTVCLVALLWGLNSVVALVDSSFALSAPAYHRQNEFGLEPSISSFEAFRLTYDRARRFSSADPSGAKLDTVAEPVLRQRYETYRADRITATQVAARQALLMNAIYLLLAAGVFVFHWRWV